MMEEQLASLLVVGTIIWCLTLIIWVSLGKPPAAERTLADMDNERYDLELEANEEAWHQSRNWR